MDKAMTTLPTTLSGLLRCAVEDAKKCDKDPRYTLDMTEWHQPIDGVCHVCMAGAVIAQRLKMLPIVNFLDDAFDIPEWADDIDYMRLGGFRFVGPEDSYEDVLSGCAALVRSTYDNELFRSPWPVYLLCADMLEEAGL